jgi:hypothetical protein
MGEVKLRKSVPVKQIWVNSQLQGQLAWLLLIRAEDVRSPFFLRYWIAATDAPQVLAVDDLIYSAEPNMGMAIPQTGKVRGTISTTPGNGNQADVSLSNIRVTRMEIGDLQETQGDGTFTFSTPSGGSEILITALFGKNCVVMNDAGVELRLEANPSPGQDAVLNFSPTDELDVAQVTAFYWVNQAAEFTKIKIGDRLSYLPTRVNITPRNATELGNAFWDGFALNFFRSFQGFQNTAYCDIILHEYGHAVDSKLQGIHSRGYSEGFGDTITILMTRQPIVGRDFYGMGQHLRDAREDIKWTDEKVSEGQGEAHDVGQVYAGFVWQMIQEFTAAGIPEPFDLAKRLVLDSAELDPKDVPDAVKLTFMVDDNDNNLLNGTPHSAAIKRAAASKSLPIPPEFNTPAPPN